MQKRLHEMSGIVLEPGKPLELCWSADNAYLLPAS